MIKFDNVNIKYINDFYALYNKSFTFSTNTLILGDSVVGSKAILRLISKIDTFYQGNIYIDNKNIKDIGDKDLPVAYVPEKFELFKTKSVAYNLSYPLKIRKLKEYKIIVTKAINEIGLEEFFTKLKNNLKTTVFKLNNQQKIIVALLRAVIRKPKFILIEDLFKNLSEEYKEIANNIIKHALKHSTIIACEESEPVNTIYKTFEIINLNN